MNCLQTWPGQGAAEAIQLPGEALQGGQEEWQLEAMAAIPPGPCAGGDGEISSEQCHSWDASKAAGFF